MGESVSVPVWLMVVWLINLGISFWNARVVGLAWVESKRVGGWLRVMIWAGAVMAACGFIWCYLVLEGFVGHWLFPNKVTVDVMEGVFYLGYLVIAPAVIFSGFLIWIDSLIQAYLRRDFASIGRATWNTFAQAHNTYRAFKGMPEAWRGSKERLSGRSRRSSSSPSTGGKGGGALLILILVFAAVILGILTTYAIVMKYAGTRSLSTYDGGGALRSREAEA